jgi:hypothetical protein
MAVTPAARPRNATLARDQRRFVYITERILGGEPGADKSEPDVV